MELVSRNYQAGDETAILKLFIKCFNYDLGMDFWSWRFLKKPEGRSIIRLMFDDGRLVGHYAANPVALGIGQSETMTAFSMTTMTDPEYAGRGIFTRLAQETYDMCHREGIKIVFGFPNEASHHGFIKKLGWYDFGELNVLCSGITCMDNEESDEKDVIEIKEFDEKADALWLSVRDTFNVAVPRKSEFLRWRFDKHPQINYHKLAVFEKGSMAGYIVLKIYENGSRKRGHLVDFISKDEGVFLKLVNKALWFFRTNGIHDISCIAPRESMYFNILKEKGFYERRTSEYFGASTYFGAKVLDKSVGEEVTDARNWHITMADLDFI